MKKMTILPLVAMGILGPAVASADLVISDIRLDVHESTYVITNVDSAAGAYAQFQSEASLCSELLSEVNKVGGVQTCGTQNFDISTLITVVVSSDQTVLWELGADWGRGGVIFDLDNPAAQTSGTPYVGDYWWGYNWNNSDVISFTTVSYPTFGLGLLGFEGCCGGGTSLRYSLDDGQTWNIAAVNVPEPPTLALLGLGLVGLGFSRRRED